MSITKISGADLHRTARGLSVEESAALDRLTDEQIESAALADVDARPVSSDMLHRGRRDREDRLASERLELLGVRLTEAEQDLDLPIWEITDEKGRKVLIKAAAVQRAASQEVAMRVLKLEAVQDVPALRTPERQVS